MNYWCPLSSPECHPELWQSNVSFLSTHWETLFLISVGMVTLMIIGMMTAAVIYASQRQGRAG